LVNIIVVFPKQQDAARIRNLLVQNGHYVTQVCTSGGAVIHTIDQMLDSDGIIISGYKYQDMSYRELYQYIPNYFDMMVMASRVHLDEIFEYNIVKVGLPVRSHEFLSALRVMESTLVRKRKSRRQKPRERTDAEKELIEHAKGVLIENKRMTEEEAHHYLQSTSMNNGTNIVETSQMIIELYRNF